MAFPGDEIQVLKAAYAALNRGDVAAFVGSFDPEVVRVEFEGSPGGGIYRGLEEVKAHVAKGRGRWAQGACEPQRFMMEDRRIIAVVEVRVRLEGEEAWREGQVADVYSFRDGKVIEFRSFASLAQAVEWVDAQG